VVITNTIGALVSSKSKKTNFCFSSSRRKRRIGSSLSRSQCEVVDTATKEKKEPTICYSSLLFNNFCLTPGKVSAPILRGHLSGVLPRFRGLGKARHFLHLSAPPQSATSVSLGLSFLQNVPSPRVVGMSISAEPGFQDHL
jgi:hypothetical protein